MTSVDEITVSDGRQIHYTEADKICRERLLWQTTTDYRWEVDTSKLLHGSLCSNKRNVTALIILSFQTKRWSSHAVRSLHVVLSRLTFILYHPWIITVRTRSIPEHSCSDIPDKNNYFRYWKRWLFCEVYWWFPADEKGLTENDGHENDGPSKLLDMKFQDMKLQDNKMQDKKCSVNRDYITLQWSAQVFVVGISFTHKHPNALCVRYYVCRKIVSYWSFLSKFFVNATRIGLKKLIQNTPITNKGTKSSQCQL